MSYLQDEIKDRPPENNSPSQILKRAKKEQKQTHCAPNIILRQVATTLRINDQFDSRLLAVSKLTLAKLVPRNFTRDSHRRHQPLLFREASRVGEQVISPSGGQNATMCSHHFQGVMMCHVFRQRRSTV